jgi:Na+/H+ antiporter NhaD/arsenite permease-like protein
MVRRNTAATVRIPAPMPAIPVEFVLFGLTLLGVALLHRFALHAALGGLAAILAWKLLVGGFRDGPGLAGLLAHLQHEWVTVLNLFALLVGFALLAKHFEDSRIPDRLPALLPDDWRGGLVLLALVFVLSSFLDNIAAAMIGGSVAARVYRERVHIGFIAAIVAASNAGGSGSVIGDTTTTMMWIDGVAATNVLHAYVAAGVAFVLFAIPAALQQQRHQPIQRDADAALRIDWAHAFIVAAILASAVAANVVVNVRFPSVSDALPFLGLAVWVAILATAPLRRPDWSLLPGAAKGSTFLIALVLCASLMPVEKLPAASWPTALQLGFLSAVFDNIPLTKLALDAGGYDWGFLAYAVGFGGSMLWFGSSAGVAICNRFPQARSAREWLTGGWYVPIAYVAGFFALLATLGWEPHAPHR